MGRTILVVDDDDGISEMVRYNLKQYGYDVTTMSESPRAVETVRQLQPDLLILDVMMPEVSGLEICRDLRLGKDTAHIPILMLTARRDELDKVAGLDIGADDYLVKPFSYRELLARVHALLRRASYTVDRKTLREDATYLVAGPLSIDLVGWRVTCRGKSVELQPKEFALLTYLVRNRGTVLTRDQLLQDVWGYDFEGGMRTVDVHIRWLREKLEENPADPQLIQTVLRVGYCFR